MSANIVGRDRMIVVWGTFTQDLSHEVTPIVKARLDEVRPDVGWQVKNIKFESELFDIMREHPLLVVAGQYVRYRLGALPGTTRYDDSLAGKALDIFGKLGMVQVMRYEITPENGPDQVATAVGLRVLAILEATK